jgi:hypothetical protein
MIVYPFFRFVFFFSGSGDTGGECVPLWLLLLPGRSLLLLLLLVVFLVDVAAAVPPCKSASLLKV